MDNTEKESSRNKILLDQVDDLFMNLSYTNWSVILISSFMVWILWPVTNHNHLMLWDAYILLIVLIREDVAIRYNNATVTDNNVNLWLKLYISGVFLSGIGWGMSLIFLVPANQFIYLVTACFLVCGLVTGSAATLASLKYGFAVFSIPALLPGALYLMYLDIPNTFTVGCSLFLFLIFILFVALRMHKTIFYSLKQQVEVGKKLSVLEVENSELLLKYQKLKDELEFESNKMKQLKDDLKQQLYPGTLVKRIDDLRDERFVSLLESLKGGVWDLNVQTGEITFSKGWLAMLGYDREDVSNIVQFWESLLHPDEKLIVLNKLNAFIEGKDQEFLSSHRLKNRAGEWVWVMTRAHGVIWGRFGELLTVVGMEIFLPDSNEVTEKSLSTLHFDLNDCFFTQENFDNRVQHLIKTASVEGIDHTLCHLKIIHTPEQFSQDKSLQDIFLYEVGSLILREFRQGDAILQLGNDSFMMVMEFCNLEDAWEKAHSLNSSLNNLQIKFKGAKHRVTVAIGITPILNSASTVSDTLQNAEKACDLAIKETSNLIYLYQTDNQNFGINLFEKHVAKRIRDSILNNEIGISAFTLRALRDAAGKEVINSVKFTLKEKLNENFPGADYSAIARKNYLSPSLDTFVIKELFEWLQSDAKMNSDNNGIYFYECSDISYLDERFMEFVLEELESHPVFNNSLCLGISEMQYLANPEKMKWFIEKVKSAGCRIALTNVGSTSMTVKLLQEYQADYLKMDKSLMQNLETDKSSYITVKYINDISHLAGMKSIVDDVNDISLLETLGTINIDYVQGSTVSSSEMVIR